MYGYLSFLGGYGTMVGAFGGAIISIMLALKIATIRNKVTATQLVLAGIAVSALFGAITNFMIYHTKTGSDKVKTATYWMMGSLSGASWERLKYATIAFVICFAFIMLLTRQLDVLLLGDDVASTVGLNTDRLKTIIILIATLLTGIIVSISGTIGFVGLTIPHITRSIVGTKHKRLVPASMLVGGTFLEAMAGLHAPHYALSDGGLRGLPHRGIFSHIAHTRATSRLHGVNLSLMRQTMCRQT
jgi:iron complex transport system permease protein